MACRSHWQVVGSPAELLSGGPRFFTEHEWDTVEAATARIMPTDHDPGAREAHVVRYIDRYLSGIDYVYAAADGSGFLRLDGKLADAWRHRIDALRQLYREGVEELDRLSADAFGAAFATLTEERQDAVLERLSGAARPVPLAVGRGPAYGTALQSVSDAELGFFGALTLHTRQGFYGDPVYGGNAGRVGWQVIGFPGPESLADTNDCSYSVADCLRHDVDWADLIPHLRDSQEAPAT
jgi:gluconate 2-dehydrogenase gamma chain